MWRANPILFAIGVHDALGARGQLEGLRSAQRGHPAITDLDLECDFLVAIPCHRGPHQFSSSIDLGPRWALFELPRVGVFGIGIGDFGLVGYEFPNIRKRGRSSLELGGVVLVGDFDAPRLRVASSRPVTYLDRKRRKRPAIRIFGGPGNGARFGIQRGSHRKGFGLPGEEFVGIWICGFWGVGVRSIFGCCRRRGTLDGGGVIFVGDVDAPRLGITTTRFVADFDGKRDRFPTIFRFWGPFDLPCRRIKLRSRRNGFGFPSQQLSGIGIDDSGLVIVGISLGNRCWRNTRDLGRIIHIPNRDFPRLGVACIGNITDFKNEFHGLSGICISWESTLSPQ